MGYNLNSLMHDRYYEPEDDGYRVALHGSFENIDLAQATLALMDMRKIEGTTEGKFEFDSHGRTADDLMKALSGTSDLTISNGTLNGVNLATILSSAVWRLNLLHRRRYGRLLLHTVVGGLVRFSMIQPARCKHLS